MQPELVLRLSEPGREYVGSMAQRLARSLRTISDTVNPASSLQRIVAE